MYLLIEELLPAYGGVLDIVQKRRADEAKWIRDFVSPPVCHGFQVCAFVADELPSAVISTEPMAVQFDRTQVEHANFIGRHEPMTYEIARRIVDAAIDAASTAEANERA